MKNSRGKKALINTLSSFGNEIISVICGLILPRLILTAFGSSYNGITSSISQFISCIALMRSGIGGVTRAALYKPLAEKDDVAISAIVVATERFMRKIALIFACSVVIFAAIYPMWICKDFEWDFTFFLVIIIATSTFVQYYFGLTYQMLLAADQKQMIVSIARIISIVLNTIFAALLIRYGAGIHVVKMGSTVAFAFTPIIITIYVKRHYHIDHSIQPNMQNISQRWDAFGHEIANFINTNTDIIVLTLFAGVKEVSVYTVYNHVVASIRKIVTNCITSFGSAFGDMYAKKEFNLMHENLGIFEIVVFSVASIIYSVTISMICPFALIYTRGVVDVSYDRPLFGIILTLAGLFTCFRIPYYIITTSVGHYKQTRNGAFFEAGLNIVVSVICVFKYGIVGVAIGTLCAAAFRSFQYAIYMGENILKRNISIFIEHVVISLIICLTVYGTSLLLGINDTTIQGWLVKACVLFLFAVLVVVITDLIFWRKETKIFLMKTHKLIEQKKHHE